MHFKNLIYATLNNANKNKTNSLSERTKEFFLNYSCKKPKTVIVMTLKPV